MKRISASRALFWGLATAAFSFGCNALLGNSEGSGSTDPTDAASEANIASDADVQPDAESDSEAALAIPTSGRDDSKPPCTTCAPVRIATLETRAAAGLAVDSTSIYWTDSIGVHRISKEVRDCNEKCGEMLSSLLFGAQSETGLVLTSDYACWLLESTFECIERRTNKQTRVNVSVRDGTHPNPNRFYILGDQIFILSQFVDGTLMRAHLPSVLLGTAKWDTVRVFNEFVTDYVIDGTTYAWAELLLIPYSGKTYVQWPGRLEENVNSGFILAPRVLYNGTLFTTRVPVAGDPDSGVRAASIVRQSRDATSEYSPSLSGIVSNVVVESSGVYVGDASGGIRWMSLHFERSAQLTAEKDVRQISVSNDGIYMLVRPDSGSAELWKIPFE